MHRASGSAIHPRLASAGFVLRFAADSRFSRERAGPWVISSGGSNLACNRQGVAASGAEEVRIFRRSSLRADLGGMGVSPLGSLQAAQRSCLTLGRICRCGIHLTLTSVVPCLPRGLVSLLGCSRTPFCLAEARKSLGLVLQLWRNATMVSLTTFVPRCLGAGQCRALRRQVVLAQNAAATPRNRDSRFQ